LNTEKDSNESTTKPEESSEGLGRISPEYGARQRMTSESSLSEDTSYAELQETCRETFKKIAQYLNGELTG
jgi:hypothetical protein